jgi:hypothetical protein
MNRAEIEAILGPPGDYRTGLTEFDPDGVAKLWGDYANSSRVYGEMLEWQDDSFSIQVGLGPSGNAELANGVSLRKMEQTVLERILWRVKRGLERRSSKAPGARGHDYRMRQNVC